MEFGEFRRCARVLAGKDFRVKIFPPFLCTNGAIMNAPQKYLQILFSGTKKYLEILLEDGMNNDIGTAREAFFLNQVGSVCSVTYPKRGDFLVDGKYLFEVGGKGA